MEFYITYSPVNLKQKLSLLSNFCLTYCELNYQKHALRKNYLKIDTLLPTKVENSHGFHRYEIWNANKTCICTSSSKIRAPCQS